MSRMNPKALLLLTPFLVATAMCACSRARVDLPAVEKLADAKNPTPMPSSAPLQTPTPFIPPPQARFLPISDGVIQGRAWKKVQPEYPLEAQAKGVVGTVRVQITIEAITGKVVEAKVLSGPPLLQEAALRAAREWLYRPANDIDWVYVVGTLEFKFPSQSQ
jgi:TonB family protein